MEITLETNKEALSNLYYDKFDEHFYRDIDNLFDPISFIETYYKIYSKEDKSNLRWMSCLSYFSMKKVINEKEKGLQPQTVLKIKELINAIDEFELEDVKNIRDLKKKCLLPIDDIQMFNLFIAYKEFLLVNQFDDFDYIDLEKEKIFNPYFRIDYQLIINKQNEVVEKEDDKLFFEICKRFLIKDSILEHFVDTEKEENGQYFYSRLFDNYLSVKGNEVNSLVGLLMTLDFKDAVTIIDQNKFFINELLELSIDLYTGKVHKIKSDDQLLNTKIKEYKKKYK